MVNSEFVHPQRYLQFASPPVLAQATSQGVQIPNHQANLQHVNHIAFDSDQNRRADCQLLDERIRAIEGFSAYSIDAKDLCLVPNLVLPPKFKALNLPKYKGLSCPISHIIMYYMKMPSYIDNDKLLIHCFQDGLFGGILGLVHGLGSQ